MLQKTPGTLPAVSAPILLGPLLHHLCLAEAAPQKCPKAGSTPEPSLLFPAPLDGSSPSPEGALGTCRCCRAEHLPAGELAARVASVLLGGQAALHPAERTCTGTPTSPSLTHPELHEKESILGPLPKELLQPALLLGELVVDLADVHRLQQRVAVGMVGVADVHEEVFVVLQGRHGKISAEGEEQGVLTAGG